VPPHLRETESERQTYSEKKTTENHKNRLKETKLEKKKSLKARPHNVGQSCNNFLSETESHVSLVKHYNTDLEETRAIEFQP